MAPVSANLGLRTGIFQSVSFLSLKADRTAMLRGAVYHLRAEPTNGPTSISRLDKFPDVEDLCSEVRFASTWGASD